MRRRLGACALIALFTMLAACGDDAATTTTTAGQTTTTAGTTTTTKVDLTGQSIEVAAVWSGEEQAKFQRILDEFTNRTGAQVTFTSTGDDIATVLGTRVSGGSPPDVAMLPQPGLLSDLAQQNVLKPLDDAAGKLVDENFAPIWRQLGSVDGTLYGVWFKAANKSTFWYNKNVFTDAGVQPPTTWEELKAAAAKLQSFGIAPFSVGAADGWVLTDWFENVYIRSAGADMYDKLARHEIPWTDPSVTKALTSLGEVWQSEWLAGGTSGALQVDFDASVPPVFADPPQAAMIYEGDFVAGVIKSDTQAQLGTDADFFAFPSGGLGTAPEAVVGGGDVAVMLKDSAGAKELIKFLASPDAAEIWAPLGGYASPNKNVDLSVYPDEVVRRAAEQLTEAQTFRFDMSDLQPSAFGGTEGQGMWKILQDFLGDPSNVDGTAQALETAAAQAFAAGD